MNIKRKITILIVVVLILLIIASYIYFGVFLFLFSDNDKYLDEMANKYGNDTNLIVYNNDKMIKYKNKDYWITEILPSNEHDRAYMQFVSNEYLVYEINNSLYIKSINEEKMIITSKSSFHVDLIVNDCLYFKNKENYFCYNIISEKIEIVSQEAYINSNENRYAFTCEEKTLTIEDKNSRTSKKVTLDELCENKELNEIQSRLKKEKTYSYFRFWYALEYENKIYIMLGSGGHGYVLTISYDYVTGNFDIYDFFEWNSDPLPWNAYYFKNGQSEILDYMCR